MISKINIFILLGVSLFLCSSSLGDVRKESNKSRSLDQISLSDLKPHFKDTAADREKEKLNSPGVRKCFEESETAAGLKSVELRVPGGNETIGLRLGR